jgi:hypothetical protein
MNETRRWIAKCKRCKTFMSTLASNINRADENLGSMFRDGAGESGCFGNLVIRCRCCGKARLANPVRGILSEKHVCNAKCLSSTGTICECSCGGKNHGASHTA